MISEDCCLSLSQKCTDGGCQYHICDGQNETCLDLKLWRGGNTPARISKQWNLGCIWEASGRALGKICERPTQLVIKMTQSLPGGCPAAPMWATPMWDTPMRWTQEACYSNVSYLYGSSSVVGYSSRNNYNVNYSKRKLIKPMPATPQKIFKHGIRKCDPLQCELAQCKLLKCELSRYKLLSKLHLI